MGQLSKKFNLNLDCFRQCRQQLGLSLADVQKKVKPIAEIESGDKRPTYKQLATLADMYEVPEWVFVSDNLPEEYQYTQQPAFRMFAKQPAFKNSKVRALITRVEQFRDFFLELNQDIDEPVAPFSKPKLPEINDKNIIEVAKIVRGWLTIQDGQFLDFLELKNRLELKGIFIFLTSKYNSWSYIDKELED